MEQYPGLLWPGRLHRAGLLLRAWRACRRMAHGVPHGRQKLHDAALGQYINHT
jgi:hypothetical protein